MEKTNVLFSYSCSFHSLMEGGGLNHVSVKLRPLKGPISIPLMLHEWMLTTAGKMLKGEAGMIREEPKKRRPTWKTTRPSYTSFTINPTRTGLKKITSPSEVRIWRLTSCGIACNCFPYFLFLQYKSGLLRQTCMRLHHIRVNFPPVSLFPH